MLAETSPLLARLRGFLFPGGEEAARRIRAIRNTQRGKIRSGPGVPWMPFVSEETIEATRSGFRWEARLGREGTGAAVVTDAYEDGHGWGAMQAPGASASRRLAGPEFDRGELQRYLASLPLCPPMLLANSGLIWDETAAGKVRVRDRADPTGAWVEIEVRDDDCPVACHAERPRTLGKQIVNTAWSVAASDFREWEGMRIAYGLEAAWHPGEGSFAYVRSAVTSLTALF